MFDINSTITRRNGIRKSGTLLPHLQANHMYEVYQGLNKIRPGTLYLFLNRYDPAATMRGLYGFDDEFVNFVISKLTHITDNGERYSDAFQDEFDYSPSKAGPRYEYNGYGFYTERFQGTIIPVMYHWVSYSNDSLIVERRNRVSEYATGERELLRHTCGHGIPDDVVVKSVDVSTTMSVSFEGQSHNDKLFTFPASSVSVLSPTPCASSFNGLISRYVDSDNPPYTRKCSEGEEYERMTAINAHDFYKHYVA